MLLILIHNCLFHTFLHHGMCFIVPQKQKNVYDAPPERKLAGEEQAPSALPTPLSGHWCLDRLAFGTQSGQVPSKFSSSRRLWPPWFESKTFYCIC